MIDDDFPLLRQLAASSVIGQLGRGAIRVVHAARDTSSVAHQVDLAVDRARTNTSAQRRRSWVLVLIVGVLTHFVLMSLAPAYARSAVPIGAPLLVAAIALVVALATNSERRR